MYYRNLPDSLVKDLKTEQAMSSRLSRYQIEGRSLYYQVLNTAAALLGKFRTESRPLNLSNLENEPL